MIDITNSQKNLSFSLELKNNDTETVHKKFQKIIIDDFSLAGTPLKYSDSSFVLDNMKIQGIVFFNQLFQIVFVAYSNSTIMRFDFYFFQTSTTQVNAQYLIDRLNICFMDLKLSINSAVISFGSRYTNVKVKGENCTSTTCSYTTTSVSCPYTK
jgi:hypothetical protein